jgi:hypothetical protein
VALKFSEHELLGSRTGRITSAGDAAVSFSKDGDKNRRRGFGTRSMEKDGDLHTGLINVTSPAMTIE